MIITHMDFLPIFIISFHFYILIVGTKPIQSRVQFLCNVVYFVTCQGRLVLCLVFSTGNMSPLFLQTLIEKEPPLVLPPQHHLWCVIATTGEQSYRVRLLQIPTCPNFCFFKPSSDRGGQLHTNIH